MIKIQLVFLCLVLGTPLFAQTEEYPDPNVLMIQRLITEKVISELEEDNIDSIIHLFDNEIENLQIKLEQVVSEINNYEDDTDRTEVLVRDGSYNIHRWQYSDTTRVRLLMDLYLSKGQSNSKILRFVVKNDSVLKTEFER